MSEQELNSYRLTSMEEPTDEMLRQIMHEAAQEAVAQSRAAHTALFKDIMDSVRQDRSKSGSHD